MQGWNFDARSQPAPINAFGGGVVPEGWYKVVIRKSNSKPTRADPQNSGMLALECEIIEGSEKGRFVYWNLNLWNQSQQAVEIAYKQLTALSHVTGVFGISAQAGADNFAPMLHNIPFFMFVVIAKGEQGPINNVRGLRDINGNEPGKAPAGGAMPQQPAPQVGPSFGPPAAPQAAPGGWQGGPAQPSQVSAPGGWGGQPAAPAGAPAPSGWGGGPAPAPQQPQGAPAPAQWGGGQPAGQPQPGPAPGQPSWGAPAAPGAPPPGNPAWPGPQGQGGAPQTQWPGAPGQPAGGPAPGGPSWGGPGR